MSKENYTKYALLGLLTTKCRTGYEIKQMMDRSLKHFWKISYGQIYPNLKKLIEEGLATVQETIQEGKPNKKEYFITEKGLEQLKQWLQQPIQKMPEEKNELLLKLFFSRHQEVSVTLMQIINYEKLLNERLKTYHLIKQSIKTSDPTDKDATFWLITLNYGIKSTEACMEWCEETKKQLKNMEEMDCEK